MAPLRPQNKRKSLKWSMAARLLFGWFVPLLAMILLMIYLVSGRINKQVAHTITTSGDKAVEICTLRIEDCSTASKNASYLPTIRECYQEYLHTNSKRRIGVEIPLFLGEQYRFNPSFRSAILYLTEEPDYLYYTYNNSNQGTFDNVVFFQKTAGELIQECAQGLDTANTLLNIGGRIYLVRNLMKPNFEPYAVLSLELNEKLVFESMESVWGYRSGAVYINGELLTVTGGQGKGAEFPESLEQETKDGDLLHIQKLLQGAPEDSIYYNGEEAWLVKQVKMRHYVLTYLVQLDRTELYAEMTTVRGIFILLIVFMIPLFFQIFLFFQRKVTKPLMELVKASQKLEEGHYGDEIANTADSAEFYYTNEVFNAMSRQLKNQFEKIYLEEIALRDAKIMALQAQINPHFLNNTLEIINWEARLNENYKVSAMIEALSVMLEATMNRKALPMIPLTEELSYVDAYLYIISQRFGEKFHYEKQVDESLLEVRLPRLIIQPIVENAVEHGIDISRQGQITLRIFREQESYMVIEVEDNGVLTEAQKQKIDRLLSGGTNPEKEGSVSLGIRNVDQRLKIIYGEDCGLSFCNNETGHTVSRLLLRTQEKTMDNQ